jgi:uncharacterized protein YbjT (DUF2867 family)
MKVIVFGATGMIGQGVLRECLLDPEVSSVLAIGRTPTGQRHAKLREIRHDDFTDFSQIAGEFAGHDACLFCLGMSSVGMSERDYRRVTYDITMAAARTLAEQRPGATFVYISGAGTNSAGRSMWARVKGETENALLALPLNAYMIRPAYIQPTHGTRSKTSWYRLMYAVALPFYPVLRRLFPRYVITSDELGRAMIAIARHGAPKRVLETADLNAL